MYNEKPFHMIYWDCYSDLLTYTKNAEPPFESSTFSLSYYGFLK